MKFFGLVIMIAAHYFFKITYLEIILKKELKRLAEIPVYKEDQIMEQIRNMIDLAKNYHSSYLPFLKKLDQIFFEGNVEKYFLLLAEAPDD